ncbi:hypothetical protein Ddc_10570 [Ditylenchus destructor]|nr:hypothetical protein Ddc_10570 [Ditylenchus destructor]
MTRTHISLPLFPRRLERTLIKQRECGTETKLFEENICLFGRDIPRRDSDGASSELRSKTAKFKQLVEKRFNRIFDLPDE